MLWSYLWFRTRQPLNILPHRHPKSRWLLRNTVQSHLGNHQVVCWICVFCLLHKSFSGGTSVTGAVSAILPPSSLLLSGSSVRFMAVSQDHHLTDVLFAFQESSSRGVWARFPWLGTHRTSHICHRFSDSVLAAVPNFQSFVLFPSLPS